MTDFLKLTEEEHLEKAGSHRGVAELYDGAFQEIASIHARFADNGTVKYVVLSDKSKDNILYLQGNMVKELYKYWEQMLGSHGPSEKKQLEEESILHDVKLTTEQLKVLHKLLNRG